MKAINTHGLVAKNLPPYMGIQRDQTITFTVQDKPRLFRVFSYQAYNAYGLIGSELNGIAIADEDRKTIVCDGICRQSSGFFGASQDQYDEFERIVAFTWEQFRDYVNAHPRARERLEGDSATATAQQFVMPDMKDSPSMTANEKKSILSAWAQFFKGGFRESDFVKDLYKHLVNHCSFASNYNLEGFYRRYFGELEVTLKFLDQFDYSQSCRSVELGGSWWLSNPDYSDLNTAMVDIIAPYLPSIRTAMRNCLIEEAKADIAAAQAKLERLQAS